LHRSGKLHRGTIATDLKQLDALFPSYTVIKGRERATVAVEGTADGTKQTDEVAVVLAAEEGLED
jgi:hypothetical protein